jgi:NADH-quinone oxidoreductase subunit J
MHALISQGLFYFFAGLALFAALLAITQNNPVRCVLSLVCAFIASSVLWLLLQAEFLALILVLVYVGAVMTLFLFVVMMLNIDRESMKGNLTRYLPFGLVLVALLTGLLMVAIPEKSFKMNATDIEQTVANVSSTLNAETAVTNTSTKASISNTEALGLVLYTDYVLAFELAAVILLVAIIAAISLAHREKRRGRYQNVLHQMLVMPEDRVKLVKMQSEKEG